MAAPTVFITVPKYVAITPANAPNGATIVAPMVTTTTTTNTTTTTTLLPKIKPAPPQNPTAVQISTTASSDNDCSDSNSSSTTCPPRGKKRRLDHLTWEEKIQRKKLKNRVAAQTSRDRKKARMEEMECEIKELTARTQILVNKCESLQVINDSLLEKNQKLDMEVETLRQQLQELQNKQQQQQHSTAASATLVSRCAGCESLLNGSAVSKNTDPLQQGSNPKDFQSTQLLNSSSSVLQLQQQLKKSTTVSSLWRVIALCLLYKICSYPTSKSAKERSMMQNLMPASWKNLPKASLPISQQTWRLAIERAMRLLPKLQAEQSDCLDQWWGPQQSAWNPANIQAKMAVA
ncbi:X-box-binding protein 1 [Musca domestica]|uniref:X-box-binding protein 1 n=1 Tax=Musca domestica TaxID=7370 RepID=A0A9J7D8C9_MUSDO|nr:X-box-binding protein 1 [Musca domestica]